MKKLILALFLLLSGTAWAQANCSFPVTYTTPGTYTCTVPSGTATITVTLSGAGAASAAPDDDSCDASNDGGANNGLPGGNTSVAHTSTVLAQASGGSGGHDDSQSGNAGDNGGNGTDVIPSGGVGSQGDGTGGAGGAGAYDACFEDNLGNGGNGDAISGSITVSAGWVLTITVGAGGAANSGPGGNGNSGSDGSVTLSAGLVATPIASPAGGTYSSNQSVTLSDSTSGASIYYTVNGTTPTCSSTLYTVAISVPTSSMPETIEAIGCKSGNTPSSVASFSYSLPQVATPVITLAGGLYSSNQTTTITDSTSGSTIYYTTNGTTPTTSSSVYSSALTISSTETLEAVAEKTGWSNSAVVSANYLLASSPQFTDNFSTYYQSLLATSAEQQMPLDTWETNGVWTNVGMVTPPSSQGTYGVITDEPIGALAPIRPLRVAAVTSGYAVGTSSTEYAFAYVSSHTFSGTTLASAKLPTWAAATWQPESNTASGIYRTGDVVTYSGTQYVVTSNGVTSAPPSGGGWATTYSGPNGTLTSGITVNASGIGGCYFGSGVGTNASLILSGYTSTGALASTPIASVTGETVAAGSTIALTTDGTYLYPTINGATPPGMSASYLISSSCPTSGSVGIGGNGGYLSDFSGGATTVTANSYAPSWPTYTGTTISNGTWTETWPWFNVVNVLNLSNANNYANVLVNQFSQVPGVWGLGTATQGVASLRGWPFGPTGQWVQYSFGTAGYSNQYNVYFMMLEAEPVIPGNDGGTFTQGYTVLELEFAADIAGYYVGIEELLPAKQGMGTACAAGKNEYQCKPVLHATKATPVPAQNISSTASNYCAPPYNPSVNLTGCNNVVTMGGSNYMPQPGDQIFQQYLTNGTTGTLSVACKGNPVYYVEWNANTAVTAGSYIVDSNGNWEIAVTAGTTGATQPTWSTPSWTASTTTGATTTDMTVTWEYMFQPCPSSSHFTWVPGLQIQDNDMATAGVGAAPAAWIRIGNGAGAGLGNLPPYYGISAGTATASTACALDSNLCSMGQQQPHSWTMF